MAGAALMSQPSTTPGTVRIWPPSRPARSQTCQPSSVRGAFRVYGRGCGLDIAFHWQSGAVTETSAGGAVVTIPAAAGEADGWYRGGVLRFGLQLGFITGHAGAMIALSRPMPELAAALAAPELDAESGDPLPVMVDLAPGCDLRPATCADKFGNLANFGGFPEIPGRNPLGGGSIV